MDPGTKKSRGNRGGIIARRQAKARLLAYEKDNKVTFTSDVWELKRLTNPRLEQGNIMVDATWVDTPMHLVAFTGSREDVLSLTVLDDEKKVLLQLIDDPVYGKAFAETRIPENEIN